MDGDRDDLYVEVLLAPLRESARYTPKFGQGRGRGLDLEEFRSRYGADPLYSWVGFDNDLLYAAHKAAGGMTSLYRQLGIGCERLFRHILRDELGLTDAQVRWSYTLAAATNSEELRRNPPGLKPRSPEDGLGSQAEATPSKSRTLALDGRLAADEVDDDRKRERVIAWLASYVRSLGVQTAVDGAVFEVRQGYKSKDAKRQNADLANATHAYTKRYLPVLLVFSNQIDEDVARRYREGLWGVLRGDLDEQDPTQSTFAFFREIVGYDLGAFFGRTTHTLRAAVDNILRTLLTPDAT